MLPELISIFFRDVLDGKDSQKIIAYKGSRALYQSEFVAGVKKVSGFLSRQKAQKWGVFCDDSWEFAIVFFALIATGKDIILPGNWQKDTQEKISKLTDAIIAVSPNVSFVRCIDFNALLKSDDNFCFSGLNVNQTQNISIFTSGSTGEPKLITKTLDHFVSEVADLEKMWGETASHSTFVATVSHQHIYGLLFKILWPVLTSKPFHVELFQYPEELVHESNKGLMTLISSPAQLKRLPESNQSHHLKNKLNAVFSSGGALAIEANKKVSDIVNVPVIEVFGSSETGGVAFRQAAISETLAWQSFPSVQIKQSPKKQLAIKSPFVAFDGFYIMEDQIELIDSDHFLLRGRSDRIVKIEEKRLSLEAMEKKLQSHFFVKNNAVTVLEGSRQVVAAVVELSSEGILYLKNNKKKETVNQLKSFLLEEFERILLPKKWRFVSRIPSNPQGKVLDKKLKDLFSQKPFLQNTPVLVKSKKSENKAVVTVRVPGSLSVFLGHFESYKVLPGVQQSLWIINYCREYFDITTPVISLERFKFNRVVRPDDTLQIEMLWEEKQNRVKVFCYCDSAVVLSGLITFSGDNEAAEE